jgi:hypothetical protein
MSIFQLPPSKQRVAIVFTQSRNQSNARNAPTRATRELGFPERGQS